MAGKKPSSLDKVLDRLDRLDDAGLRTLVQRLARERALLETVFNTLQEGVLVITADGEIDYANVAARGLIGFKDETGAGTTLWRLVPGLRASLEGATAGGPKAGQPVVTREFELTYPAPRVVRLYMVPFSEGEGGVPRFAIILTDITSAKKSTEELIENEKVSSILLLAAGVAHELGNPLNSLTIHLQLIERKLKKLKGSKEADSLGDSIRICQDEVTRLDGIIRNFLEAIRPRPPDLAEVNVVEVIEDVLRFQGKELADRGLAVEAELPASTPVIMADRNQLKQVFFNLVKNAMEAMPAGGKLGLRVGADDDSVFVRLADTGAGIKTEDLAKLFSPYHTTKTGGHGLGLMIVQRIMRDHGGHVGIESKEGVGTVVTLQFPQKHRRVRMLPGT
ncbi:ATP-binding protein [Opitutus sp. GAS368]|jgi:two-component system, sporulation sensor kinase E|uniref:two-component system sensor histidine kinase NtrB n=1 Tax=Opitutus sp. GAS368 TaxID=1882749 RepID=UPI00087A38A9|nr:ATP-binding protein [Opitutus sp. GAS368]SDR70052.1 PAS domain S-box-containing protein [Opitutus sp. GAS368]